MLGGGFPLYFWVNDVPNMSTFGAAKQPNIKEIQGSERVRARGSSLANSPENSFSCFFSLPMIRFSLRYANLPVQCSENDLF